jgi:L-aminopeptidase/D-esterase-like protein
MKTPLAWTVAGLGVLAIAGTVVSLAQRGPASSSMTNKSLTAVAGIRVGHFTLSERPTGCTVVVVDGEGAIGGYTQRGGAPGTRDTELLNPLNSVEQINAIFLTGGSAYGISVGDGVSRYLEEKKVGYKIAGTVVPIVPGAVLMDLGFGGSSSIRPNADCGYRAASTASDGPVAEGNIGAGAGSTVGKLLGGRERAMKAGVGTFAITLSNGLVVAALVAVNAVGDIVDPTTGAVIAGVRTEDGKRLADARLLLRSPLPSGNALAPLANTTIAVVATNARLTKAQASRMALMADDGLARAINPAHTPADGDTVFALATGRWEGQADSSIGALAAEALSEAIVRAATQATASGGLPAARDLGTLPSRFK